MFAPDEPIEYPIDGELDLHQFAPKDTREVVLEYIRECLRRKIYSLRIIHGKGIGVKRRIVHNLLDGHPDVVIGAERAGLDGLVWYEYPESSWGQDGYMRVAFMGDNKRSFVHYHLPILPEGTQILEAYMELYHGGKNEDGYTDDLDIMVQRASDTWSPETLTWNNQPSFTRSTEFYIDLRSQAWSASTDIVEIVREMFDDPDAYYGFIVEFWSSSITHGIEKGFDSNNYSRTADDLKHSPRLLVKIELPLGKTTDDIILPPLASDNDLDFGEGVEILMLRYSGGSDWPSTWNVVAAE